MSILFKWDEMYSVGNQELDDQHKRMFELGNSLSDVTDEESVKATIGRIFEHTDEHFTAEEEMMRVIGYPNHAQHRSAHQNLLRQLEEMSGRSYDSHEAIFKFRQFIYRWVIKHILEVDRDYFRFARKQRQESS